MFSETLYYTTLSETFTENHVIRYRKITSTRVFGRHFFADEKIHFESLEAFPTERKRNKREASFLSPVPYTLLYTLRENVRAGSWGEAAGNGREREPRLAAEKALSREESSADRQKVWRDLNLCAEICGCGGT